MNDKSIFGAKPEQLNRLLTAIGLEKPDAKEQIDRTDSPEPPAGKLTSRIGRYKLISVLGEGGMGIVYLAEQQRPIRRQVALKVIKPGMDSARIITRFEAERQALALLDHPNIAHVYDAGTTETGRPYFVMEYVNGLPITEHCDGNKFTITERLNLFLQVCQAVHHAHQKGIIHRDIKPSNILISTDNDKVVPKIIDFGIAKAISQPLTERKLVTEQDQLFGTPEYMSPEQADMVTEDVDTRSDIYSLGVLLYVLLTGILPFDSDTLRTGSIENIRQIIRETDPKTPSTRLVKLGDRATAIAENRRMETRALVRHLRKELEWIPLKAMRKERSERYRSASEFADDVENYLNGAPLMAGPPSAAYKLRKFVRRYQAPVTGIAAVMAALVAGIVVSTVFAIRAEQKAKTAQAVSEFLTESVLAMVDPVTGDQPGTTLESILEVASHGLNDNFEDEPLIKASIRYQIGRTYWHIGKYDAAESNLKRAIELRRNKVRTYDQEILMYKQELAWVYFQQSKYDETESLLEETVDAMRPLFDKSDPIWVKANVRLGWVYNFQGQYKKAEKIFTEGLEVPRDRLGPDQLVGYLEGLSETYRKQGRLEQAEEFCRKAIDINRREHGENHNSVLNNMRHLGEIYCASGRYDEAEEVFTEALQVRRKTMGEENPRTLILMRFLGSLYIQLSRYDEAEQLLISGLQTNQRLFGDENGETLYSAIDLARLYRHKCNYNKAEQLLLKAEATARRTYGNNHKITSMSVNDLIALYEAWNKPEKAKEWRAKLPD